ncbi:hypothetical protein BASA81_004830 [Batrachochytrium salamandrivorans]|nr:hypothetical protein BASA81_004830 [Batrachochytrium salamandrivorans]
MEHRAQAGTGMVISAFAIAHMTNHFLMHFGPEAHQAMFRRIRQVLQRAPILELTLFASLGVHAAIGVKKFTGLHYGDAYFWHQISGCYFGRFAGPKAIPEGEEYDTSYVAMAIRLVPGFFMPLYGFMMMAGAVHTYTGVARAGRILDFPPIYRHLPIAGPSYYQIILPLAAAGLSTMLAMAGVYFRYGVKHEPSLAKAIKADLPKFIADRLDLSGGVWFARFRFFPAV